MTTINPHTTRAVGTILTASIYNTDHQNHIANASSLNTDKADAVRNISAGTGLTGGGNLTADRTLSIDPAYKIQVVDNISFEVSAVDTSVVGSGGGAFLIELINGATGGSFNAEISLNGGTNYTAFATVLNNTTQRILLFAKSNRAFGLSNGSAWIGVSPTSGSGTIRLRCAAGGSSRTATYVRLL